MAVTPQPGQTIVVYDHLGRELGEGTFQRLDRHGSATVYECEEHTILASAGHRVEVRELRDQRQQR